MARPVVVRLYSIARDAAGTDRLEVPVEARGVGLAELLAKISDSRPALAPVLPHCRFARNGVYLVGRRGRLASGDELAIHPPYSGG